MAENFNFNDYFHPRCLLSVVSRFLSLTETTFYSPEMGKKKPCEREGALPVALQVLQVQPCLATCFRSFVMGFLYFLGVLG